MGLGPFFFVARRFMFSVQGAQTRSCPTHAVRTSRRLGANADRLIRDDAKKISLIGPVGRAPTGELFSSICLHLATRQFEAPPRNTCYTHRLQHRDKTRWRPFTSRYRSRAAPRPTRIQIARMVPWRGKTSRGCSSSPQEASPTGTGWSDCAVARLFLADLGG